MLSFGTEGLLLGQLERRERRRRGERGRGWRGLRQEGRNGGGPGKSVRHHIVLAGSVMESCGKFRKEGQLALLAAGFGRGEAVESGQEGLMVSKHMERTALQEGAEMEEGGVNGLQLPIKSGVIELGRGELGREEGQRTPRAVLFLLEDGGHVSVRRIGSEGKWRSRVRVSKNGGGGKGPLGGREGGRHV